MGPAPIYSMGPMQRSILSAAIAALILAFPARAQQPAELTTFLHDIGLDAGQQLAMSRGGAVVKVLATGDQRDVAIFGIVTIPMTRDAYVRQVLDFSASLAQPSRELYGIYAAPATPADMQRFTIDDDELGDLRKCRPNDCDFKLPGVLMDSIQMLLQGPTPQQLARASTYARARLATFINEYRAQGVRARVVYDDRGRVIGSEAFDRLLSESPYGMRYSAAITRHFDRFPADTLPGGDAREVIYWSQDHVPKLRRTLTVWHRVVYTPPDNPNLTLIAAKQIYADHYFEAGLDLSSVIPASATSSYLLVLRRYRFDNLPQGILKIHDRAVSALSDQLRSELARLASH
jgi:hypothetical protein